MAQSLRNRSGKRRKEEEEKEKKKRRRRKRRRRKGEEEEEEEKKKKKKDNGSEGDDEDDDLALKGFEMDDQNMSSIRRNVAAKVAAERCKGQREAAEDEALMNSFILKRASTMIPKKLARGKRYWRRCAKPMQLRRRRQGRRRQGRRVGGRGRQ